MNIYQFNLSITHPLPLPDRITTSFSFGTSEVCGAIGSDIGWRKVLNSVSFFRVGGTDYLLMPQLTSSSPPPSSIYFVYQHCPNSHRSPALSSTLQPLPEWQCRKWVEALFLRGRWVRTVSIYLFELSSLPLISICLIIDLFADGSKIRTMRRKVSSTENQWHNKGALIWFSVIFCADCMNHWCC